MIVPERPTQADSKLLENIERFRVSCCLFECVVGSGCRVAVVIKSAAVECIAPGARDGIYKTGRASIERRIGTERDLKFFNCIFSIEVRYPVAPDNIGKVIVRRVGSVDGKGRRPVSVGISGILPALLPGRRITPKLTFHQLSAFHSDGVFLQLTSLPLLRWRLQGSSFRSA